MSNLARLIGGVVGWGRQRKSQLTDRGEERTLINPNQIESETFQLPNKGTLSFEFDSVNNIPLNFIILDDRNLTYLQAGQADYAPVFESGMTTEENIDVNLPEGDWHLIVYNEDQREQAILYMEWEIDCTSALGV
jgi:hypothetical protein